MARTAESPSSALGPEVGPAKAMRMGSSRDPEGLQARSATPTRIPQKSSARAGERLMALYVLNIRPA